MDTEETKNPSTSLRHSSGQAIRAGDKGTHSKQKFNVGDKVKLGDGKPGRVICTDAINLHQMSLLALMQHSDGINEQMYQFSKDGLCLLALNRGENESHYEESNLYLDNARF